MGERLRWIGEWIRRLRMGRYKYTLSYDGNDQENAAVCGILAALGNKRSMVVRTLIMDAVRRYGADVLKKENVNVLIYLIDHNAATGFVQQPVTDSAVRKETAITFPSEKKQKRRTKRLVSKDVTASERSAAQVNGVQMFQEETGDQEPEAGSAAEIEHESSEAEPENEGENGSSSLLDFLNVGIFEGQ